MGSLTHPNFGGSGRPKTRKIWAATKKNKIHNPIIFSKKITTKKEVEDYFSNEKIECLICGKYYACLGMHVSKAHNLNRKQYNSLFGLPLQRGLAGKRLREKWAKNKKIPNFEKLREYGLKPKKGIKQTKPKCWLEQQSMKSSKAGKITCEKINRNNNGRFISEESKTPSPCKTPCGVTDPTAS